MWSRRSEPSIPGLGRTLGAVVLCLLPAFSALAARILPVGVLGNSGESGDTLVRVTGATGPLAPGVAVDADLTLWLSGGEAVNHVALDGRLLERFALEPPGSVIDSRAFVVAADTLCFLGRLASGEYRLFALPLRGEASRTAAPLPIRLPARRADWLPYVLAGGTLDGALVLVAEPKASAEGVGIYLLPPDQPTDDPQPAFTLPGQYPSGATVDGKRRMIYIGASLNDNYCLRAVGPDRQPGEPIACTKTPAIPTQFRGVVSLAGGALWETAWYGFLSRLDLQGCGAPGRIIGWQHELGYPTQVVGVGAESGAPVQLVAIASGSPESTFLAHWRAADERLVFTQRLGCLPTIAGLGLSAEGWVTVGTYGAHLWWPWSAGPSAPPGKGELHVPVTPPYWDGDRCFALAAQYALDDLAKRNPVGTVFSARPGDRNEARRVSEPIPFASPVGLTVAAKPGDPNAALYVTESETNQLRRTGFWLPELKPDNDNWAPVPIAGISLSAPTDVQALTDGRLLLADAGRLLLLTPTDAGYSVERVIDHWGDAPEEHFGDRLRFGMDGSSVLVSDTRRHRVLWFDFDTWQVLGQFGETDVAGSDRAHLASPAHVALCGTDAVVADAGNQRVVKLALAP